MLDFKPLTIEDRAWVQAITLPAGRTVCDYSFLNLLLWTSERGGVARVGDFLCPAAEWEGETHYFYPVGRGDPSPALEAIRADAQARGIRFLLYGVTNPDRRVLELFYPGRFTFLPMRDCWDYLYPVWQLTELAGKSLQAKRNHINRFCAEHPDWKTLPLSEETAPLCMDFAERWYAQHAPHEWLSDEREELIFAIRNFRALGADGLLLSSGDGIVAFSLGCRLTETVYDVNFEKADPTVNGAYALINREFARMVAATYPEITQINREDDMGLEGLRKAKESYHPQLLEISEAVWTA